VDGARRARIATLLVVVSAAACGGSTPTARSSPPSSSRPPASVATSTTSTTSSTAMPSTATTAVSSAACVHEPVLHADHVYYYFPTRPARATDIDFTDFTQEDRSEYPLRDGRGDTIISIDRTLEERRPDGTVTLLPRDSNDAVILRAIGDFDGDGRTDLLVELYAVRDGTWIVPGTTAPGRWEPEHVGIHVPEPPNAAVGSRFENAGDQNHDGADDVLFERAVYSGRQLTAGGAGTSLPAPLRVLPAVPLGILSIGAGAPPTFVVPGAAHQSLDVLDARRDRLLVDSPSLDLVDSSGGLSVGGWSLDGHVFVRLDIGDRGGMTDWRWDLEAPCQ
jgi:hypothetical protein